MDWIQSSVIDHSVSSEIIGLVEVLEPDGEECSRDISTLNSLNEWRVSTDLRCTSLSQSQNSVSVKSFDSDSNVCGLQDFHTWDGDQVGGTVSDLKVINLKF